ncbi:rhodanese-like domain-containing protein [uncultured Aquimarina sp.]|uniref:rhodanese-like domain-containing protein n=1 Tax=uncultured Aquimarina sp. TaxID=575652 RepID=UPI002629E6F4|nr:rhodanese-like domain-containing protein [uncultured Aquimarina sp.]
MTKFNEVSYIIYLMLLLSVSVGFSQQNFKTEKPNAIKENNKINIIDINTLVDQAINKDVQLIDIRTIKEYTEGYIDDAINISFEDREKFALEFQKLNKEKPVFIYCYSGWRSHRAAKLLVTLGFNKIYDFKGGYKAWSAYSEK